MTLQLNQKDKLKERLERGFFVRISTIPRIFSKGDDGVVNLYTSRKVVFGGSNKRNK